MSGLKLLLMISAQDDFHFIHYFPQSYEQPYKVNELVLYTKFFKKCGKFCVNPCLFLSIKHSFNSSNRYPTLLKAHS